MWVIPTFLLHIVHSFTHTHTDTHTQTHTQTHTHTHTHTPLFPGGSDGKESAFNAGDPGSVPGWGRSPEEGNGYPSQYSCLENPIDIET